MWKFISILVICGTLSQPAVTGLEYSTAGDGFSAWRNTSAGPPEQFVIDELNKVLIVAVRNSVFQLSLNLSEQLKSVDTAPNQAEISHCTTNPSIAQTEPNCQNFHHVLLIPTSNDTVSIDGYGPVDIRETVVACGSNAFQPKCSYLNRTSLNIMSSYNGEQFCPTKQITSAAAITTGDGRLLSGSSKNTFANKFGLSVSTSPFNGTTSIRTIDDQIMFKSPTFVDIYDIGNFYYVFLSEPAIEVTDDVIYSRVARVCKNDPGVFDEALKLNIFTSFLKARMSCSSDAGDGPVFYYNNLKDTEYIESGMVNTLVNGRHLYAIFSGPVNGPAGSMLCVFTFDGGSTDLDGVFSQKYLKQIEADSWRAVTNTNPVDCQSSRTEMDARTFYLMDPIVSQTGDPLLKLDGMIFQKLIIEKIEGVNNKVYDVILIAANEEDFLKVLKMTYVYDRNDEEKTHISQETRIDPVSGEYEDVASMDIYKDGDEAFLYLSTTQAIYRVSITNCSQYNSCRSCVESRDPYCAFDTGSMSCVSTLSSIGAEYIQDIDNGIYSACPVAVSPSSTVTPPTLSTKVVTTSSDDSGSSITLSSSPGDMSLETLSYTPECSASVDLSYVTVTSVVTQFIFSNPSPTLPPGAMSSSMINGRRPVTSTTTPQRPLPTETPTVSREPTVENLESGGSSNDSLYMTIGVGFACFLGGIAAGIVVFACLRNKDKFIWGKMLSRNRRLNFSDDNEKGYNCNGEYEMCHTKIDDYEKNNAYDFVKDTTPRPSTPPLTKLNPTTQPGKVTDSPVLSKYTPSGKGHNRSLSSGGQFPSPFTLSDPPISHSPVPESPVRKNIRNTYHVEEGVSNIDRQKYGKNVVSKQLSREYPMSFSDSTSSPFHAKTNSLDLNGWKVPR